MWEVGMLVKVISKTVSGGKAKFAKLKRFARKTMEHRITESLRLIEKMSRFIIWKKN